VGKHPFDYSIEYSHIYTNEQINDEHAVSIRHLKAVTNELDKNGSKYNLCVMVDDYSFPEHFFDYNGLLNWLEKKNAEPHLLVKESRLIPGVDEVLSHIKNAKRQKQLRSYIERKRYPCSLFIAAWYLGRLGKLEAVSFVGHTAERLINVLPSRFKPFEDEAMAIIGSTRFADCSPAIKNVYT
jgi:hypothetical protein